MDDVRNTSDYPYHGGSRNCSHAYLIPTVRKLLDSLHWPLGSRPVFDLGCGNGAVAAYLAAQGYEVTGVDPSEQGIKCANSDYPHLSLERGSAYDDLANKYGKFPVVISLEVVEHVYSPREFAATVYALLEPNGTAIISTPYHGYWKNLALAVSGRWDAHFGALSDNGHIKFWSMSTLRRLLADAGFSEIRFIRVGRIWPLAKSMIAIAKR